MTDRRRWGWLVALLGAAAAFGLGWLAGQREPPPPPAPPAPSASLRPEDVELRLDAGGLSLMPEGGLELKPIEPLGGASGAAEDEKIEKVETP